MSEEGVSEEQVPAEASGTVVTFYSYKGGTGRSMALANTAWLLASSGSRVLVVDWDLEAPGLHRYFHPFLHDPDLRSTRGVMDMIWDFAIAVMSPQGPGEEEWFARSTEVMQYAVSLTWPFASGGTIDFVCSGRHDAAYAQRVNTFDWNTFYEQQGGGDFIDALRADMRSSYDWILIDSRTGLSDTAGICTVQLPDVVVNCFTLSSQSIDGAVSVARSIDAQGDGRTIRLLPVLMRADDGEQRRLELGRDVARAAFNSFLRDMDDLEKERYWGDVEVPYKPYYAYEEILAVFGDRPRQEGTLLAAYERLTSHLTHGVVSELPPQDELRRRETLEVFERARVTIPTEVVLSYSSADRPWADWAAAELEEAGFRVIADPIDSTTKVTGGPLEGAVGRRRLVAIFSRTYLQLPAALERWRRMVVLDPDGAQRLLVPVRVEEIRLSPEIAGRDVADLVGLDGARARRALAAAAGKPSQPAPATTLTSRFGEEVRFPGAPPRVWEGVPVRNPAFVGREELLASLRDSFLGLDGPPVHCQVLQGLGGVGKTQLAAEYVFRFGASYDLVYWFGCDQMALVRTGLNRLAVDLGLTARNGREGGADVVDALRRGVPYRRWLLVFDNAEVPGEILPLIPPGPGHVIVTSRSRDWGQQSLLEIDLFSRRESIGLLLLRAPGLTEETATRLAEALGDLPLALDHAGAWHSRTGMPAERYLQLLEDSPGPLLLDEGAPVYPPRVFRTWLLSMQGLRDRAPAAARLAQLCAFFGPEPISLDLFASVGLAVLADADDQRFRDDIMLGEAVRQLVDHALARLDPQRRTLVMHRLVQTVIREDLASEQRTLTRARVHALLGAADPGNADDPANWPRYDQIRPHLEPSGLISSRDETAARVVRNQVRYLYMQRDHGGCRDLAQRTLEVWRGQFGADDARTLELCLDLADSYRALGEAEQAHELDRRARDSLDRRFGPSDPLALRAAMALGGDLRGTGNYQEARELDEATYHRYHQISGLDSREKIKSANNLAVSLRFVGDFKHALVTGKEAYDRQRRMYGDDDILTLQYADSYARDLRELGRYRESAELLEQTLGNSRRVLGEDHPDTLRTMANHAVSLRWVGQLGRSLSLAGEAFGKLLQYVGENQPITLASAVGLVNSRCLAGAAAQARELASDTVRRADDRLGVRDLSALAAANGLVIATRLCGEPRSALDLANQTRQRIRESLAENHPFAVACSVNLANCLFDLGQFAAARQIDEEAVRQLGARLGDEAPAALLVSINLAADHQALGDEAGARALRSAVLTELATNFEEDDSLLASLRSNGRADLCIDPPPP
ncbi:FxSxx-COOH system tetratricopeptide repeat protein [Frankia sp. CcI49]|uniref:FxSxx-COOH system tetratricopeptide repeat protein n=1 Tax=Frankia sp. CcI49 TaxID=1745382 RepID=UPI001F51C37B|nr:FxSxx-COOH system tetratricopeptide repeat protein [Frankia sp. CcI49]